MSNLLISGAINGVVFGLIMYLLYRVGFGTELQILDPWTWIVLFLLFAVVDYFIVPRAALVAELCKNVITITAYLIVYPALQRLWPRTPPGPKN